MNTILNGAQSDTKRGEKTLLSNSDLTGKENLLLKIVNVAGVPQFDVPAAITDMAIFVCMSGGAAAAESVGEVPGTNENCRVLVNNAVNPGDILTLDPNSWGRLYKPAAASGATVAHFVAEEAAAAAGLCLVRKIGPYPFTP